MSTIDVKDRKILSELDKNARQSNEKIGRKVGLSRDVVKYRIDRLREEGIIIRFHTIINYCKLGLTKYKLYIRLTNVSKEQRETIAEYFKQHTKTEWVVIMTGRWDIIVDFLLKNANEFDDEIQEAMNKFSSHIQEKAMTTSLYLVHQERSFLSSKSTFMNSSNNIVYHTLKDEQVKIDEMDEHILQTIANNARMSSIDIAKLLKTTSRVIQYRMRELEKKKVILAYKAHIEPTKMNRIFCKAILSLSQAKDQNIKKILSYASTIPGAVWPQRVLGTWDFEIDLELQNYDDFQDILLQLRERFPDLIKNHEFCITWKELKLDFYPNARKTIT